MTRILVPVLLLGAALGLFVFYTNSAFQDIKTLSAERASYDEALTKAQQLRELRDKLLKTRASFSADDVAKLAHVLPDNVDNIRLIIDINNIATRHNVVLSDVQLGDTTKSVGQTSALAVGPTGSPIGTVQVGFSVAAHYEDFLAFLQDLEHSLRIVDVDKLSLKTGVGDLDIYTFEIRTYWLH
jgi:Tfp pilus assembly protein PilO